VAARLCRVVTLAALLGVVSAFATLHGAGFRTAAASGTVCTYSDTSDLCNEELQNLLVGREPQFLSDLQTAGDGASIEDYFSLLHDGGGGFPPIDDIPEWFGGGGAGDALPFGAIAGDLVLGVVIVSAGIATYEEFVVPKGWPGPVLGSVSNVSLAGNASWVGCNAASGDVCALSLPLNYDDGAGTVPDVWHPEDVAYRVADCNENSASQQICFYPSLSFGAQSAMESYKVLTYDNLAGTWGNLAPNVLAPGTALPAGNSCTNSATWEAVSPPLNGSTCLPSYFSGDESKIGGAIAQATTTIETGTRAFPLAPDRPWPATVTMPAPTTTTLAPVRAAIAAEPAIRTIIDQNLGDDTFTVPDCHLMTWAECVAALRAAGFLGWIYSDSSENEAAVEADAGKVDYSAPPAGTEAPTTTAITLKLLLSPNGQPYPDPLPEAVAPDDANPPDTTSAGSVPQVPNDAGSCTCPPIDFSPLQGLSLGSKFPFGAFTYVTTMLSDFDVSATAPSFDVNVTQSGTAAHHIVAPGHFSGTLSFLDPYMVWMRGIETFVLWLGAVWFVGAKILGFGAAGDLGDVEETTSV
jgi:hypothetical protein